MRTFAFFAIALSIQPARVISQPAVGDKPTCATCRIVIERVASIGDPDGPGLLGTNPFIAVDSKGRIYATAMITSGRVLQFDSKGKYVRDISRRGRGPGEFMLPRMIEVGRADSLYIMDVGTMELSQFGPAPANAFARRRPVSVEMFYAVPIGKRIVVSGPSRNRELQKFPLHMLDSAGKVVRSYGTTNPNNDPATFYDRVKAIGPAHGAAVWTAGMYRYRMELWDTTGTMLRSIVRESDWFKPYDPDEQPFYRVRPGARTTGVRESGNLLWVITVVAAKDWAPIKDTSELVRAGITHELESRFYDSIVEVFDLNTGTLLASQRFDQTFDRFIGDGLTYSYTGDDAGNTVYTIWRLKLQR